METLFKQVSELSDEDTLIGDAGGESLVYEARPSSANPGLWLVTTEHGHLLIDPDIEVAVKG